MTADEKPIVACRLTENGTQFYFQCPHCKTRRGKPITHYHGAPTLGHRVAHCPPGSPFFESGYVLALAEHA
jgi:hypothetical protein